MYAKLQRVCLQILSTEHNVVRISSYPKSFIIINNKHKKRNLVHSLHYWPWLIKIQLISYAEGKYQ
jgi:uncharacterized protein Veg